MSEKIDKLVRMANQVADFFGPYPDEEAVAGIQQHIRSFWTPRMRAEVLDFVDAGGQGPKPRVIAALTRLRAGPSPIAKVTAGPETLGQATSDAG
jgi:formate dehydrogenase subunit delta